MSLIFVPPGSRKRSLLRIARYLLVSGILAVGLFSVIKMVKPFSGPAAVALFSLDLSAMAALILGIATRSAGLRKTSIMFLLLAAIAFAELALIVF